MAFFPLAQGPTDVSRILSRPSRNTAAPRMEPWGGEGAGSGSVRPRRPDCQTGKVEQLPQFFMTSQAHGAPSHHMKITFICAVFPPEPAPAGVMACQLAARLASEKHRVTMIVPFPNRPEGVIYPGFHRQLRLSTETAEGYALIRCACVFIGKQRRSFRRVLENLSFGISSAWALWRAGRPDVLILETWPLLAAFFPVALARWWGVPYLYYVQDVYPEAAEEAGIFPAGGTISRVLRWCDRYFCLHSARVIVISETMRSLVASNRRLPHDRFTVIPNWIDESAFPIWEGERIWRRSMGIPDSAFVALFAGTLGHVSGAEVLVEVAQKLTHLQDILLLCIGEGVRKEAMRDGASGLGLTNIRFLPFQPGARVPEVQASCEVALLTVSPTQSDTSVPSKLISYLAASRPVVCAARADSTVAMTITDSGAGVVVPPGDAQAIADAIVHLMHNPRMLRQMGESGRQYFEENFTFKRAYARFSQLLCNAGEGARGE